MTELNHNLKRLSDAVHNAFLGLDDDNRYMQTVEFFRELAAGGWEEVMSDALDSLGYTVTKDE